MTTSSKGFEALPISQESTNPDLAENRTETREQDPNVREFSRRAIVAFLLTLLERKQAKKILPHTKRYFHSCHPIYEKSLDIH